MPWRVNISQFLPAQKYYAFAGISFGKFFIGICLAPDGLRLLTLLIVPNVVQSFTVKFLVYPSFTPSVLP